MQAHFFRHQATLISLLALSALTHQAVAQQCALTLDQSNSASVQTLQQQADDGEACAQFNMGYLHYTQQSYSESEHWYAKAAEQGVARAAFEIAILYRDKLLPSNEATRQRWLTQAAEQGLDLAQIELGLDYLESSDPQESLFKAMYWFERAAQQGNASAQYQLGNLYWSDDRGVQFAVDGDEQAIHFGSSDSKALYWICKAAQNNHADAQFSLSEAYVSGRIMPNRIQSHLWLELAASNGSADAKQRLDSNLTAWYTQLEEWVKRKASNETARCPDEAREVEE
nr:tetratricopeptide repeat protein [uncultured Pseudomonas sp.]